MTPPYHSWAFIQRSVNQYTKEILAYCGISQGVQQSMNKENILHTQTHHGLSLIHKEK
jgi:hypothetical protein